LLLRLFKTEDLLRCEVLEDLVPDLEEVNGDLLKERVREVLSHEDEGIQY
jgi:hypothetical protein